jgi:D-threo-aldose 1-dehydrogenase
MFGTLLSGALPVRISIDLKGVSMKTRPVGKTDLRVSEISFGCAPLGNLYRPVTEDAAQEVLAAAWDSGIRFFDTAPHYGGGLAEERLGRFLNTRKRDDYVISTKVGRILHRVPKEEAEDHAFVNAHPIRLEYDYSGDGIMRSLEASHERMGLDRFDILFVHDIGEFTHGKDKNDGHMKAFRESGIKRLNDLRDQGVIKAWGVGVNEVEVLLDIMQLTELDCILMAGRYSLLDRSAERDLLPLCRARGTSFIIGGVFNSGILATGPVPGATFNYAEANEDVRSRVAKMQEVAMAAGTDLATAALQFPFHEPVVASVLLGTTKASSLKRNLASMETRLDKSVFAGFEPHAIR